jgi:hypothetical protein
VQEADARELEPRPPSHALRLLWVLGFGAAAFALVSAYLGWEADRGVGPANTILAMRNEETRRKKHPFRPKEGDLRPLITTTPDGAVHWARVRYCAAAAAVCLAVASAATIRRGKAPRVQAQDSPDAPMDDGCVDN